VIVVLSLQLEMAKANWMMWLSVLVVGVVLPTLAQVPSAGTCGELLPSALICHLTHAYHQLTLLYWAGRALRPG